LNLPAHQVGERRTGALVGNHQRVDAGVALDQLDREMTGGAKAGRSERVLVRILADEVKEILEIVAGAEALKSA